jgi:GNAT superfamily N-acetyltransferase
MSKPITHASMIRRASPADAETLARFNTAMALETEGKTLDAATVAAGVLGLFERPERGFYLVCEEDGRILGALMITYEWSDWRNADFWWLQSVYVRPEARRRGVFARLYRAVAAQARAAGACGLRLYVEQDNEHARKTYQSLGMDDGHYRMMEQGF